MTDAQSVAVISGSIAAGISTVGVVVTTLIQRYYEQQRLAAELEARLEIDRSAHRITAIRDRLERRREIFSRFLASIYSQVSIASRLAHELERMKEHPTNENLEKVSRLTTDLRESHQIVIQSRSAVQLIASSPTVDLVHEISMRALLLKDPSDERERDAFRMRMDQLAVLFRVEIDDLERDINDLTGSRFFHPDFSRTPEERFKSFERASAPTVPDPSPD